MGAAPGSVSVRCPGQLCLGEPCASSTGTSVHGWTRPDAAGSGLAGGGPGGGSRGSTGPRPRVPEARGPTGPGGGTMMPGETHSAAPGTAAGLSRCQGCASLQQVRRVPGAEGAQWPGPAWARGCGAGRTGCSCCLAEAPRPSPFPHPFLLQLFWERLPLLYLGLEPSIIYGDAAGGGGRGGGASWFWSALSFTYLPSRLPRADPVVGRMLMDAFSPRITFLIVLARP